MELNLYRKKKPQFDIVVFMGGERKKSKKFDK